MPYKISKSKKGYYVVSSLTGKKHSKKALSLSKAHAQMRAMYANMPASEKAQITK